jgi:predicted N-acetyltransferase YhbS
MIAATAQSSPKPITIRRAQPEDIEVCGRICFEGFTTLNQHHNFPPDFPTPEVARQAIAHLFSHPGFFCVVAEQDGKVVGSNCLDERCTIAGIGPITIDPSAQNRRVGWQLMTAVMDRAAEKHFPGVRLVQAAFHCRSMSLYAKLGFDVREPLVVMQGPPIRQVPGGYSTRAAVTGDLEACNSSCRRLHGHDRSGELSEAITRGTARVAEHDGRIVACSSDLGFWGHTLAENNTGLQALLGSADGYTGPGFLLPTRNTELFRWCLDHGLRVVEPMTLMTAGLYNEPVGAYLPSISY